MPLGGEKKKKRRKKSFYYTDNGCSGNKTNAVPSRRCCRTAPEAASRQPAQPDWLRWRHLHAALPDTRCLYAGKHSSSSAAELRTLGTRRASLNTCWFGTRGKHTESSELGLTDGKHNTHEPFVWSKSSVYGTSWSLGYSKRKVPFLSVA